MNRRIYKLYLEIKKNFQVSTHLRKRSKAKYDSRAVVGMKDILFSQTYLGEHD